MGAQQVKERTASSSTSSGLGTSSIRNSRTKPRVPKDSRILGSNIFTEHSGKWWTNKYTILSVCCFHSRRRRRCCCIWHTARLCADTTTQHDTETEAEHGERAMHRRGKECPPSFFTLFLALYLLHRRTPKRFPSPSSSSSSSSSFHFHFYLYFREWFVIAQYRRRRRHQLPRTNLITPKTKQFFPCSVFRVRQSNWAQQQRSVDVMQASSTECQDNGGSSRRKLQWVGCCEKWSRCRYCVLSSCLPACTLNAATRVNEWKK